MLSEYESPNCRNYTSLISLRIAETESLTSTAMANASQTSLRRRLSQLKIGALFDFYRVLFDARATNSSNLESKSFRMGDWFDFL